jgi:hypothetical protein
VRALKTPLRLKPARSGGYSIEVVPVPVGTVLPVVSLRRAIMTGLQPIDIRTTEPLSITRLRSEDDGVWMTDSPEELLQMSEFATGAEGTVLVGGLGLGVVARMLARKRNVKRVVVVERSADVIKLCGSGLGTKVEVIEADLFQYLRRLKAWSFDCAFYDIWQATGESEWLRTVAPLRRLTVGRFGVQPGVVRCWVEDVMLGQIGRALLRVAAMPMRETYWDPFVRAWRLGVDHLVKETFTDETPEGTMAMLAASMQPAPEMREALMTFTRDVGSDRWEESFGVHMGGRPRRSRGYEGGRSPHIGQNPRGLLTVSAKPCVSPGKTGPKK